MTVHWWVVAIAHGAPVPGLALPPEEACLELTVEVDATELGDEGMVGGRGLSLDQIRGTLRSFLPILERCVHKDHLPAGTLQVEVVVGCSGRVSTTTPLDGPAWDPTISSCVTDTLAFADFPAHDLPDGATFLLPVRFGDGKGTGQPPPPEATAGNLTRDWLSDQKGPIDAVAAADLARMSEAERKFAKEQAEREARKAASAAAEQARIAAVEAKAAEAAAAAAADDAAALERAKALAAMRPRTETAPSTAPPVVRTLPISKGSADVDPPPPAPAPAPVAPALAAPAPAQAAVLAAPAPAAPVVASTPATSGRVIVVPTEGTPSASRVTPTMPTTTAIDLTGMMEVRVLSTRKPPPRPVVGAWRAPDVAPLAPGENAAAAEDACLGRGEACWRTGSLASGDPKAADLFAAGCAVGDVASCVGHARLTTERRAGLEPSCASPSLALACEATLDPLACAGWGEVVNDPAASCYAPTKGRVALQAACTSAASPATPCRLLAAAYEQGLGVDRDRTQAARLYGWACEGGDGAACARRGDLLSKGVGVKRDDNAALAALERGCTLGAVQACITGGQIFDAGTNLRRDGGRAADLYRRACDAGSALGCHGLGAVLVTGGANGPDLAGARDAYQRAWADGHVPAGTRLAGMLWRGEGGAKDKKTAKGVCQAACSAGDPAACAGPAAL